MVIILLLMQIKCSPYSKYQFKDKIQFSIQIKFQVPYNELILIYFFILILFLKYQNRLF